MMSVKQRILLNWCTLSTVHVYPWTHGYKLNDEIPGHGEDDFWIQNLKMLDIKQRLLLTLCT